VAWIFAAIILGVIIASLLLRPHNLEHNLYARQVWHRKTWRVRAPFGVQEGFCGILGLPRANGPATCSTAFGEPNAHRRGGYPMPGANQFAEFEVDLRTAVEQLSSRCGNLVIRNSATDESPWTDTDKCTRWTIFSS
jgi:hypothetical protein